MNDLINNIVKRYESFKLGDRSAQVDLDVSFVPLLPIFDQTNAKGKRLGGKITMTKVENQVSLIDFDFDEPSEGGTLVDQFATSLDLNSDVSSGVNRTLMMNPVAPDLFDLNPEGFTSPSSSSSFNPNPIPTSLHHYTSSIHNYPNTINWQSSSSSSSSLPPTLSPGAGVGNGRSTTPGPIQLSSSPLANSFSPAPLGHSFNSGHHSSIVPKGAERGTVARGGGTSSATNKSPDPFGDLLDLKF